MEGNEAKDSCFLREILRNPTKWWMFHEYLHWLLLFISLWSQVETKQKPYWKRNKKRKTVFIVERVDEEIQMYI